MMQTHRTPAAALAMAATFVVVISASANASEPAALIAWTGVSVDPSPDVAARIAKGDELASDQKFGAARREYGAAAEIAREEGVLPVEAVRRIANTFYFEGRLQSAARTLEGLATEAASHGDIVVQAWALADAAWIHGLDGARIDMERRVTELERLLRSPYLPDQVRRDVVAKRLGELQSLTVR